jgi:hypothetical protein
MLRMKNVPRRFEGDDLADLAVRDQQRAAAALAALTTAHLQW